MHINPKAASPWQPTQQITLINLLHSCQLTHTLQRNINKLLNSLQGEGKNNKKTQ